MIHHETLLLPGFGGSAITTGKRTNMPTRLDRLHYAAVRFCGSEPSKQGIRLIPGTPTTPLTLNILLLESRQPLGNATRGVLAADALPYLYLLIVLQCVSKSIS